MTEKTLENLAAAFAGESQANRKYLAFAKKAEQEGYPQVAKLFRAISEAETIHAHSHLRQMKGVHSTAENLKAAIEGETYEFESMYPAMMAEAEAAGESLALRSFTYANEVEKIHAGLYKAALESLDKGGQADVDYYVCEVCGHTVAGKPTEKCPICNAGAKAYFKVA